MTDVSGRKIFANKSDGVPRSGVTDQSASRTAGVMCCWERGHSLLKAPRALCTLAVGSFISVCRSQAVMKGLWGETPFSEARSAECPLPASRADGHVGVFCHPHVSGPGAWGSPGPLQGPDSAHL